MDIKEHTKMFKATQRGLTIKLASTLLGLICNIAVYVLTFIWYGWKLLIILMLFEISRNIISNVKGK